MVVIYCYLEREYNKVKIFFLKYAPPFFNTRPPISVVT